MTKNRVLQLATLLATLGLVSPATAQIPLNIPPAISSQVQRNLAPEAIQGLFDIQRNPQSQNFFDQGQARFETEMRILSDQNYNPGSVLVIKDLPQSGNNRLAIEQERTSPQPQQQAPASENQAQ